MENHQLKETEKKLLLGPVTLHNKRERGGLFIRRKKQDFLVLQLG